MPQSSMRALILEQPGQLSMREVPVPEPSGEDVLVRVRAATTCGTDLKAYLRGHPQIPMPGVFGHEYSGVIEAVGSSSRWKPGTSVMGVHSAPCKSCEWCNNNQENLCESIMSSKVLGSFAQYILVPGRIANANLYEKPDMLSFEEASLLEPLSCVAQGIAELPLGTKIAKDARILVLGPGAIGLMFVYALQKLGFSNLTLGGRNELRLKIGESLGAKSVVWEALDSVVDKGFDLVIECVGLVSVWQQSLDFVKRGGIVMLFGGCPSGSKVEWDTRRIHYDQITLLSPFHFGTEAVQTARSWLIQGAQDLRALISSSRELADGTQVFEDLRQGKAIKYVFNP